MRIWVDADACPQAIREILYRAADRVRIEVTLVANRRFRVPPSPFIHSRQVAGGPDAADDEIATVVEPGDLVVTADIPLAARVVEAGGVALDPRGELYTEENIGERLTMRDLMDELRSGGVETGGPRPLSQRNRQAFASQLDRILTARSG